MNYLSIDRHLTKHLSIHGGLWTNMNLPRLHINYDEGCEYIGLSYGNDGADAVFGVNYDLAGTWAGRLLCEVGWRLYRRRHPLPAPDPTHGRIDADIQALVEEMQPRALGERVAMENTLQHRRDITS